MLKYTNGPENLPFMYWKGPLLKIGSFSNDGDDQPRPQVFSLKKMGVFKGKALGTRLGDDGKYKKLRGD